MKTPASGSGVLHIIRDARTRYLNCLLGIPKRDRRDRETVTCDVMPVASEAWKGCTTLHSVHKCPFGYIYRHVRCVRAAEQLVPSLPVLRQVRMDAVALAQKRNDRRRLGELSLALCY